MARAPTGWSRRLPLAWALAAVGLGLLAGAGVLALAGWAGGHNLPSVGVVPAAQPAPRAASIAPTEASAASPPVTPTRLRLASLGIDAPVTPVAKLPDGALAVPTNPHVLGWWYAGAAPGSPTGTVVIVGHVDTAREGAGALFDLSQARPGQVITLATTAGPHGYVIAGLRGYPKVHLPAEVFTTGGRPRLVLITCGGAFDPRTRSYAENLVAYAIPTDAESLAGGRHRGGE